LVEVIGGPFKREKAKIVRINEVKREAKIEFIDSAVPIPITIKTDLLKVIKQ
jgi:transcriptional antiterminator NusG